MEKWYIRCGLSEKPGLCTGVLEESAGGLEGRLLFCQRAGDAVASGTGVKGLTQPRGTSETRSCWEHCSTLSACHTYLVMSATCTLRLHKWVHANTRRSQYKRHHIRNLLTRTKRRHETQSWQFANNAFTHLAGRCGDDQCKLKTGSVLRLRCSLSGMMCSMRHANMFLLYCTNGCTWAELHQRRSVHVCKYQQWSLVWTSGRPIWSFFDGRCQCWCLESKTADGLMYIVDITAL